MPNRLFLPECVLDCLDSQLTVKRGVIWIPDSVSKLERCAGHGLILQLFGAYCERCARGDRRKGKLPLELSRVIENVTFNSKYLAFSRSRCL